MKEIIIKYLNTQYKFTLSTYVSYKLYDKLECRDVGLKEAINIIRKIFSIEDSELMPIFDCWADEQATIIQNKITDIRYNFYEKTGVELDLMPNDLNLLMDEIS